MVDLAGAFDGPFDDSGGTGALLLNVQLFYVSVTCLWMRESGCVTELMRAKDILNPTFMMGFQDSSGFFSLRSTRMWMEGLLYAIRGSSSFAKCLGVANISKSTHTS